MRLLAHEATHAVQQAAGPVAGTPSPSGGVISDPGDSFERAAEQAAESAAGSRPLSAPDASDGALGVALTLQRLPDGLTIQRDDGDTATATAESPPSPKPPSPTPSAP